MIDARLKNNFNMIVSGPTGTGKSSFINNLLLHKKYMMTMPPDKVILFYRIMQPIYTEMKDAGLVHELIDTIENFPSLSEIEDMVKTHKDDNGTLLIFDDIMVSVNKDFAELFCNVGHHYNTSIIFVTQNLFHKDSTYRTMSLNSQYIVLMQNMRDNQQIGILAKQISPYNSVFIVKAFEQATKEPFDYLLLDFHPTTPPFLRVRSHILPHQHPIRIYIEN